MSEPKSPSTPGVVAELKGLEARPIVTGSHTVTSGTYFAYAVYAQIGERDDDDQEDFEVLVCSPSWFAGEQAFVREKANVYLIWDELPDLMPGHPFWFMESWDQERLERAIRAICHRSSPGPDWSSVANRIGRLLSWEFVSQDDDRVNDRHGLPPTPSPSDW